MKNSFCRICRGRCNLKYPPAAVDSENRKNILASRIAESGEISDNICWDCEETLLGFHKSVGEENDEEEPVVVDDDEILYKSLEKTTKHCFSRKTEVIQIDSSDSDPEELVIVPQNDDIISVESAKTVIKENRTGTLKNKKKKNAKKNDLVKMNTKIDNIPRGRVFESMKCPVCSYHSGIELDVVYHIRQTHPQYTGDTLRFVTREDDLKLTRRIIFAFLWTFFECIECGKIHDRFFPHRKHLSSHDRKNPKDNYNAIANPHKHMIIKIHKAKRALEEINQFKKNDPGSQEQEIKKCQVIDKTLVIKLHKADQKSFNENQQRTSDENKALLRKKQLQARNERRRQKRAEARLALQKSNQIPKPTFKMPQQPAPRASSVTKAIVHQQKQLNFPCKICSKIFPSFIRWNDHMMRNHLKVEFSKETISSRNACRKCDKRFKDYSALSKHIGLSHRRKYRLVEINGNDKEEPCCLKIKTEKVSKDQQQTESLPFTESCTSFSPKSALLCQHCGFLFANLASMQEHASTHTLNGDVERIFFRKISA